MVKNGNRTAVQSLFANLIEEPEIQVPINQGQGTNNFAALPTLSKTATFVKERIHLKKRKFYNIFIDIVETTKVSRNLKFVNFI